MSGGLGPLEGLAGVWDGAEGVDLAPDDDPARVETGRYREQMRFEPTGAVTNPCAETVFLKIPGQAEPFAHGDENTLTRVG